jgi:hypothetical protein
MVTKKNSQQKRISFRAIAKLTRSVSAAAIFIFIICYIMGAFVHIGSNFMGYLKVAIVNAFLFLTFATIRKILTSKQKKKKTKKKVSFFYKYSFPIVFVSFFIAGFVEYYIINHQNLYWIIFSLLIFAVSLSVYEFWLQIKLIWHGYAYHRETTLSQFLYLYSTTVFSFAFLYTILNSVSEQALFQINHPTDPFFDFLYLSVITVSTLGYGDIVPVTTLAKLLVMLQTIVGYLFLYIFLGLVISWLGTREKK